MDALQFLIEQHREVESLFQMLTDNDYSTRTLIVQKLNRHAELEEMYFYPELQRNPKTAAFIPHAESEHDEVKSLISKWMDAGNDFMKTASDVEAAVKHHVEEEEGEMFDAVREAFTQEQLNSIGFTLTDNQ